MKIEFKLLTKLILLGILLLLLCMVTFNVCLLKENDIIGDVKRISENASIVRELNKNDLKVVIYKLSSDKTDLLYGHVIYKKSIFNSFKKVEEGYGTLPHIVRFGLKSDRFIFLLYGVNVDKSKKVLQYKINDTIYSEDISNEYLFVRLYDRRYEEDIDAHDFKFIN